MNTEATIHPLQPAHLAALLAIQAACHGPACREGAAVMARRLNAAPDTVWGASTPAGTLQAYLLACVAPAGRLVPLHGDFDAPSAAADTLYLHDLAVHPQAAGRGLGPALVRYALDTAARRGLRRAALVALPGALGFWQRLGWAPATAPDAATARLLAAYGDGAVGLTREWPAPTNP